MGNCKDSKCWIQARILQATGEDIGMVFPEAFFDPWRGAVAKKEYPDEPMSQTRAAFVFNDATAFCCRYVHGRN